MSFVEWTDDLSVGVEKFDDQHKDLVQMLNDLDDALQYGGTETKIGDVLKGLAAYVVTHFQDEEANFDELDYPGADAHRVEHKKFVDEVSLFIEGFEAGSKLLTMQVMQFLKEWLVHHIQETDKEFSSILAASGQQVKSRA
jgi:hemerythrin